MNKILQVSCPEHDQTEVIEVSPDGEIQWCSRVAGRPVCAGTCQPHPDATLSTTQVDSTPEA